jgi:hypothetical protein
MRNWLRSLGSGNRLRGRGIGTNHWSQGRSLLDGRVGGYLIDSSLGSSNLSLSLGNNFIGIREGLLFLFLCANLFKPPMPYHGTDTQVRQYDLSLLISVRKLIGGVGNLGECISRLSHKASRGFPVWSLLGKVYVSGEFVAF